jgi:hypothetical protein
MKLNDEAPHDPKMGKNIVRKRSTFGIQNDSPLENEGINFMDSKREKSP